MSSILQYFQLGENAFDVAYFESRECLTLASTGNDRITSLAFCTLSKWSNRRLYIELRSVGQGPSFWRIRRSILKELNEMKFLGKL